MKFLTLIFLSLSLGLSAQQKMSTATPEQGLIRLMEGNKRYMSGKMLHPDRSQERRDATAALQQPFAIILSCADSRVSPEIVFDQGIGDLFIVRDAGNVLGPVELDSIEFAALYLKASFILVM
ncbi:MAG: carbonic anhydrase, partial [Chlamydiales bacterium]